MRRLAGAVSASMAVHVLLLSWPVSLPAVGMIAATGPETAGSHKKKLHVLLNPAAPEPDAAIAPPPAPSAEKPQPSTAAQEKSKEAPQREQGVHAAIPMVGYYPAAQLSKMPQAIGIFDIRPPAGGDTGLGGKMTVRIWIGANGAIDSARVLDSGLPQPYAEAALAAFENLRFVPGEIGSVPVKSWVEIVIEYADFRDEVKTAGRVR
jgi:TonB family protein